MDNYANYLYIAIRAALDAGKAIMDIYTDPNSDFGIERKADNSPLTKADKKSHQIISMALSVTPFPVLSEEGKDIPFAERSAWSMLWIVDPLDGTKEFIKKNGEFTVYSRSSGIRSDLCPGTERIVFRGRFCRSL